MADLTDTTTQAARGAEVLARECLRAKSGERIVLLDAGPAEVVSLVVAALRATGAIVRLESMSALKDLDTTKAKEKLRELLQNANASLMIAEGNVAQALSTTVVRIADELRTRHLHLPNTALKVFATSIRTEPALLKNINDRVGAILKASRRVSVKSDAGTALELTLGAEYPVCKDHGCPEPGNWDNLPSGFVYFFPASVNGIFVTDRILQGHECKWSGTTLRRAPLRVAFKNGLVQSFECDSAEIQLSFERYLAAHRFAGRVGFASIPTNPLAMVELGNSGHDTLLPGLKLHIGFSNAAATKAPFDCDVGVQLTARKLSVSTESQTLVDNGRLVSALITPVER